MLLVKDYFVSFLHYVAALFAYHFSRFYYDEL